MSWFKQIKQQWLGLIVATPALVKVLGFFSIWVVCWLPIAIPLAHWLSWHPLQPLQTSQKLYLITSLYLIAPVIISGAIRYSQKFWSSYGVSLTNFTNILISLVIGIALALGGLAIAFLLENALGWVDWEAESWLKLVDISIPILLLALFIGACEELIFRGFIQTELQEDYSPLIATVITSSIFAVSHLVWEWDKTLPEVPGLWLLGVVLTQARWVNGGNLSLAWGLHAGWVWGLTCLDTAQILVYTGKGSEWFTGWGGNPLAGGSGIFCLLLTAVAIQLLPFPDPLPSMPQVMTMVRGLTKDREVG
ncbi:type II CAAX endopeptidase family protein [Merismopedia glauca]|uniref:CPBP family intramembrane metalloprotease domain-containing protein n=1 Tax=Merismopedia glauca CCAP 1448/3 TaxID=1296344 RepID=A0A2T1C590_9CYAN|nr:type II CAAX endopeptidase family protein [Merismopedia glauca]PSB03394.1 CPBP family intramembrane metalloprotease domain-containing protein [Merismopedia glauca CCAP 1448/3]